MVHSNARPRLHRRDLLLLVAFVVLLYVLLPQLHAFKNSLHVLANAKLAWVALATTAVAGMYVAAAWAYVVLARHRLRFGRTLLVEMASLFASKLLPAGIGPIGINYEYLRKNKHTQVQAGSVVAVNNVLGLIATVILVGGALAVYHAPALRFSWTLNPSHGGVIAAIVAVALAALFSRRTWRHKIKDILRSVFANLKSYRAHPFRIIIALLAAMALMACHTLTLWACARSVGLHLTVAQALIALSVEIFGATVTPTPGGIGGAEATMLAALVALGFASGVSLAVALLFRFLTYWLALLVGASAFAYVERAKYI